MRHTVSLNKNRDFQRLYRSRYAASAAAVLYCRRNGTASSRLGITTGTKLGKAVVRNRIRRRLKEAYRLLEPKIKPGYDLVLVARARAQDMPFAQLLRELEGAVIRADLHRMIAAPALQKGHPPQKGRSGGAAHKPTKKTPVPHKAQGTPLMPQNAHDRPHSGGGESKAGRV